MLGCLKFERENTWFSGPDHLALNSVLDIFGALAGGVSVWNFECWYHSAEFGTLIPGGDASCLAFLMLEVLNLLVEVCRDMLQLVNLKVDFLLRVAPLLNASEVGIQFCTRLRLKPLAAGHLEANPPVT